MSKVKTSPAAALAEAHHVLLKDLADLEHFVQPAAPIEPVDIHSRLDSLRGHLGRHFRFEEQNGYMQAVLTRAPHQERRVRMLREQHDELWHSLTDLLRRAAVKAVGEEFRHDLRAWIERVRYHETQENLLVEDTFNIEVTASD
jgi:Hemerythrin HHE cation binding domain